MLCKVLISSTRLLSILFQKKPEIIFLFTDPENLRAKNARILIANIDVD